MKNLPMLYVDPVALNPKLHKDLKLGKFDNFEFASKTNSIQVVGIEFIEAAKEYPIVFVKSSSGEFIPCTLNGIKDAENLYIGKDKQWDARYIPAYVRRYPFIISEPLDSGVQAVFIDQGSARIQKKEGSPLFNKDGTEGEVLSSAKDFLVQHYAHARLTQEFCTWLQKEDLFTEMTAKFELAGTNENFMFEHLYVVNEAKLNLLPESKLMELFKKGWLAWVYAHLMSLSNMSQLIDRYSARVKK